jgi:hypothetical protein
MMHWDAQRHLLLSGPLPLVKLLTITLITISLLAVAAQTTKRQDF